MDWVYIGFLFGSFVVSGHPTEEACLGRKAVLEKQHITGECVKAPLPNYFEPSSGITFSYGGNTTLVPSMGINPNITVPTVPGGVPYLAPEMDIH